MIDGGDEARALTEFVTPAPERISSCLAEPTVNVVISKRFAKRQQMQWTLRGAHPLLQTRTRALDGSLRPLFERWYSWSGRRRRWRAHVRCGLKPHASLCSPSWSDVLRLR